MAGKSPMTDWGADIVVKLDKIGMTRKEFCRHVGISPAYFQDLIRGRRFSEDKKRLIDQSLDEILKG